MIYDFQLSNGVAFWAIVGTIYLFIMTYKDLFNNMRVDERYNFFMMGVSLMLLTYFNISFWYLLTLLGVLILLNWLFRKFKVVGAADITALTWLIYGYGIIGFRPLVLFVGIFLLLTALYYIIRLIMKVPQDKPTPYFPVLLATFILTNMIWKLY